MADVQLDYDAVGELLKSQEMRNAVMEVAVKVAAAVDADGAPVATRSYVTDRAAAAVTIMHPKGMLMQARDGVLTRAASSVGLEVKEKPQ